MQHLTPKGCLLGSITTIDITAKMKDRVYMLSAMTQTESRVAERERERERESVLESVGACAQLTHASVKAGWQTLIQDKHIKEDT